MDESDVCDYYNLLMQKVDIYSLGIIFFEMCHPPTSTAMERHKMLLEIRKADINFPQSFSFQSPNQVSGARDMYMHSLIALAA